MYTKKQHIARKTIITCLAFLGGVTSTIFAAAVYDASIQSRANTIFDAVKKNASTMNESDATSYYNLVRLNIKSLVEVLTVVDGKILTELGSTLPGLDDGDLIGELTNTGNVGSGNTNNPNTGVTLSTECNGIYASKGLKTTATLISLPVGLDSKDQGKVAAYLQYLSCNNYTMQDLERYVIEYKTPSGFTPGFDGLLNKTDGIREWEKENQIINYAFDHNGRIYKIAGIRYTQDGEVDQSPAPKQRVFIKFTRSLPSSEYSRDENECGIPVGGSNCSIKIDWYSSPDTKKMELFSSLNNSTFTLLQTSLSGSRTLTLSPSNEVKIRFISQPNNQIDEINFKGICAAGSEWNGTTCAAPISQQEDKSHMADIDIVLHPYTTAAILRGTEGKFGLSAVFKNPQDTDTCSISYTTLPGVSKVVDFRLNGRVASSISRGRNPELWNAYISGGGSSPITILFENKEGYYPDNRSNVIVNCNNFKKEFVVPIKSPNAIDPETTAIGVNKTEVKAGDVVDLEYSVSADRTCDIYIVKNNIYLKRDIAAGTQGSISYISSIEDSNNNSVIEFEMKCSNGSKKSKDVKIVSTNSSSKESQIGINPNSPIEIRKSQIIELYRTILGREPDEPGLNYWINDSLTIDQIRENFLNSPEYKQKNPQ